MHRFANDRSWPKIAPWRSQLGVAFGEIIHKRSKWFVRLHALVSTLLEHHRMIAKKSLVLVDQNHFCNEFAFCFCE